MYEKRTVPHIKIEKVNTNANTKRPQQCWAVFFACDVWAGLCFKLIYILYYTIKIKTPLQWQTNTNRTQHGWDRYSQHTSAMLSCLFCPWCMSWAVPHIKIPMVNTITNTNRLLLCWAVFFVMWCMSRVSNIKYYTIKMQTQIKRQTNTNLSIFERSFLPVIFEMYCANLHHKIRNYKSIYHFTFHNNIFSLDDYSDFYVWG